MAIRIPRNRGKFGVSPRFLRGESPPRKPGRFAFDVGLFPYRVNHTNEGLLVGCFRLAIDIFHVGSHGFGRNVKFFGHVGHAVAVHDFDEHFALAAGKTALLRECVNPKGERVTAGLGCRSGSIRLGWQPIGRRGVG